MSSPSSSQNTLIPFIPDGIKNLLNSAYYFSQISTLFSVGENDAQHLSGPCNFNHLVLGPLANGYWPPGFWSRDSVSIPCPILSPFSGERVGSYESQKNEFMRSALWPLATAFREEYTACWNDFAAKAVQIAPNSIFLTTLGPCQWNQDFTRKHVFRGGGINRSVHTAPNTASRSLAPDHCFIAFTARSSRSAISRGSGA